MGDMITSEAIDLALQNTILARQGDRAAKLAEKGIELQSEKAIMLLKKGKPELLESSFDTQLLKVLIEVQYWFKIQTFGLITFPLPLTRLLGKKEQLRVLRENVMLIVRDYNNILLLINPREKALFNDHLTTLDKIIDPGVQKYNWLFSGDSFVNQCRSNCADVFKKINDFQIRQTKVTDQFQIISSSILTNIKKGQLYELKKFMD